ncbi:Ionotropic receptor 557 [Blattella germanica]|nr:Ionotropic receptor 557 [Blattella germanica]
MMMIKQHIVYLFLLASVSMIKSRHLAILEETTNIEFQITKCLYNMTQTYFRTAMPTLVIEVPHKFHANRFISNYTRAIFNMLFSSVSHQILNFRPYQLPRNIKDDQLIFDKQLNFTPSIILVILPDVGLNIMKKLLVSSLFTLEVIFTSIASRLIIILTKEMPSRRVQNTVAKHIFSILQDELRLNDVLLITPGAGWSKESRTSPSLDVLTWFPAKQKSYSKYCMETMSDITLLDIWSETGEGFKNNVNLFPIKDWKDMNDCLVPVKFSNNLPLGPLISGKDIRQRNGVVNGIYNGVLLALEQITKMKFTEGGSKHSYSIYCPIPFMYAQLLHHRFKSRYYFNTDFYIYQSITAVPHWQGLFRVFSTSMWLLVVTSSALACVTFWLMNNYPRSLEGIGYVVLIVLRSYLAIDIPQNFTGFIRVSFFSLWLFFCMQVYTAYQAAITGFIVDPGDLAVENKDLDKIGNNLDRSMWACSEYIENYQLMLSRFLLYNQTCKLNECIEKLATEPGAAVLGEGTSFDLLLQFIPTRHGRRRVHKVQRRTHTVPAPCFVYLGTTFVDLFNTVTDRLISGGIIDKWHQDIWFQTKLEKKISVAVGPVKLSLTHFQGLLFILLGGYMMSFTVFVTEILVKHYWLNL